MNASRAFVLTFGCGLILLGALLMFLHWKPPRLPRSLVVEDIGRDMKTGSDKLDQVLNDPDSPLNRARASLLSAEHDDAWARYLASKRSGEFRFRMGFGAYAAGFLVLSVLVLTLPNRGAQLATRLGMPSR